MINRERPDNESLLELLNTLGTKKAVAEHLGVPSSTLWGWYRDIHSGESEVETTIRPKRGKYKEHPLLVGKTHTVDIKALFEEAGLGKDDVYKVVVIPDTHYPDQDKGAVKAVKQFLRDYQPHGFGSIGDFWDLHEVSRHEKTHDFERAARLIKAGGKLLKSFVEAAGNPKFKFFCEGNHEIWINQYLEDCIPGFRSGMEVLDYPSFDIGTICKLDDMGFTTLPYNEILQIGQANLTHGCYTSDAHAKAHLNVVGSNIFYGHCETIQSYSGVNIRGVHLGQCIGTLRDIDEVKFIRNRATAWLHGFLILEFSYDGMFTHIVPPIVNGKLRYNGKCYG